jgi:hypothetical protein
MLKAQEIAIQLNLQMKVLVCTKCLLTRPVLMMRPVLMIMWMSHPHCSRYKPHPLPLFPLGHTANLLSRGDAIKEEYRMAQYRKFVCTLSLFLEVFKARCQTPGCTAVPTVKYHFVGMALFVTSTCTFGHKNKFFSSCEVNNIFVNNLQTAASIILSGSHYAKMKRLANFLNLEFLSKSSYYRFQRLYLIPEINDWWCWMRRELISEFSAQDVVVGGDGQCDSPGFNAKNLSVLLHGRRKLQLYS